MKKIIISIIWVLFYSTVLAQNPVSSGTYTVGGNISYSNVSENDASSSSSNFYFAPNLGCFFIANVYTGLSISYSHYSIDNFSNDNYGFGPTLRYYINKEKLNPFLGFSYSYNISKSSENYEADYTSFVSSFGLDYFVTNYFALEGSLNYSLNNRTSTNDNNYSHNSGSKIFSILLGAKYFIQ